MYLLKSVNFKTKCNLCSYGCATHQIDNSHEKHENHKRDGVRTYCEKNAVMIFAFDILFKRRNFSRKLFCISF